MSEKIKNRLPGPDIVRFIACLFVVCEHFFLNCGYYDQNLLGPVMFAETFFRWMFLVCIPLYLMLTGYFKLNKKPDKSHYMSIVPILIAYIVISIPKMILYNQMYGDFYTPKELLKSLANYSIAWYMGLYLGMVIILPFLNKLWHALEGKKEQHILIGSLIFLCSVYPVFNYVAPSFFIGLYPIMYYFIGAYIRENQPKFNKGLLAVMFIVLTFVETLISFFGVKGSPFNWTLITMPDSGFGSILVLIPAVCVFLIFYDIDIKNKVICKVLQTVGTVTFETYLFAGVYDAIIYNYFKRTVVDAVDFAKYFPITVLFSFIAGVISSIIYKAIYKWIKNLFMRENQ